MHLAGWEGSGRGAHPRGPVPVALGVTRRSYQCIMRWRAAVHSSSRNKFRMCTGAAPSLRERGCAWRDGDSMCADRQLGVESLLFLLGLVYECTHL